jgi:hypothetical protein
MKMNLSASKINPHKSDSPKGVDPNPPASRGVASVSPAPESFTPRPRM